MARSIRLCFVTALVLALFVGNHVVRATQQTVTLKTQDKNLTIDGDEVFVGQNQLPVVELLSRIQGLVSTVEALGTSRDDLETRASRAEAAVANLTSQNLALEMRVERAEEELAATKDELAAQVTRLEQMIADLSTSSNLADRIAALEASNADKPVTPEQFQQLQAMVEHAEYLSQKVDQLIENVVSFRLWETSSSGSYSLRTIIDSARSNGLRGTYYECVLRTTNGAHWTGAKFTVIMNYYTSSSSYPHRFFKITSLDAGSGGCSGGVSVLSSSGSFTFDKGNCDQHAWVSCRRPFQVSDLPTPPTPVPSTDCGPVLQSDVDGLVTRANAVADLATRVQYLNDYALPFKVFETRTAGTYDLRAIFDQRRKDGLAAGVYDCVLLTSNGAHWKGRSFSIIANAYTLDTHSSFAHRIFDVTTLDAGSAGCSEGLTSFDVSDTTGSFAFSPGSCNQKIELTCRPPINVPAVPTFSVPAPPSPASLCTVASVASIHAANETVLPLLNLEAQIDNLATKTMPVTLLETQTAGTYAIQSVVDDAKLGVGIRPHVYECLISTNNGAHWKGAHFELIVNHYSADTHGGYPHKVYDAQYLDAGSSGCSEGFTSWSVNSNNQATFSFSKGNCQQRLSFHCKPSPDV